MLRIYQWLRRDQVLGDSVAIVTSQLCSFNPLLNDGMQWRHRGNLTSFPYRRLT
jgi:IS5 family transposase